MVTRTIQGYGVNATNLGVLPTPILAKTSPGTTNVYYPIGQLWLNQTTGIMYMYLGQGIWPQVASNAAGDVDEIATQSGTALPVAGVITINGAANQLTTSASGGTVTLTLSGPYTPATYTAHAVLVGEGTGSIVGVGPGTAGQVLTSNGLSLDPSFQTVLAAAGSANSIISLSDDFFPSATGTGQLKWTAVGTVAGATGTIAHPGLIVMTATTATQGIFLSDSTPTLANIVGGGTINVNFVIALNTLSSGGNYTAIVGLADGKATSATPANGIYFAYTDTVSSGNWVGTCTSASTSSTSATPSIAAVTGYVNLGIQINAAGTSVSFTVNGVSAGGAVTTNIPVTGINPVCYFVRTSGNAPAADIDLFYMTQTLTTAR